MNEPMSEKAVRRGRLKLIALLSIFLAPMVAATLIHRHYQAGGEFSVASYGELITPAVALEPFSLVGEGAQRVDLESFKSK